MKKSVKYGVAVFALLMANVASASMSYECWRYVGSSPEGFVKVSADSKADAVYKAKKKFQKIGSRFDYVKCK